MTKYLFLFALALIVANVWLVNFRRRRRQARTPQSFAHEEALVRASLDHMLSTVSVLLTSTRIVKVANNWFLSRQITQVAQLRDVHSISWQIYTNPWMLLIGALLIGLYSPVGILLVMYALQTPIAAVGFQSHFLPSSWFSRVGTGTARSQIVIRSGLREHYPELQNLYEVAQRAWLRARQAEAPDRLQSAEVAPAVGVVFSWSRVVWLATVLVLVVASLQRFVLGHAVLDHPIVGALYLALPLAVTIIEGRRSGLWVALLSFLMLIAAKFPGGFLLGLVINDGLLHAGEALGILSTMLVVVALGSLLHDRGSSFLPPELALLVIWPLSLYILDPGSIFSFRTAALIVLAAGLCRVLAIAIPAALESRWWASTGRQVRHVVDLVWGPA